MMKKSLKSRVLLVSLAVLLLFSVGGTIAFLTAQSGPLKNQFEGSQVSCKVEEKEGIYTVTNTSDIKAYIRAAVVVTWQDEDGNVYYQKPNCTVTPTGFAQHTDGYYYCTSPLVPSGAAGSFQVAPKEGVTAPEGYTLKVEVLAQAIQADGVDKDTGKPPITLAWGVEVNSDGTLQIGSQNP